MDRKAQSMISRWSIAAAIFGGICNLLCWVLSNYQFYYLQGDRPIWNFSLVFVGVMALMPALALFFLRRSASIVFIYAPILFLILIWRVQHLVPHNFLGTGAVSYKIDMPGLLLFLLGVISAAVLLVRAAISFVGHIRRTQRPSTPMG